MNRNRSAESGSAFYWIFVGIALFIGLSYAVAEMGRGGDPTNMHERDSMFATDVIQYAGAIQRGIRVMRINGTDESDLCFHDVNWGHANYEFNPQCTINENRIFSAAGGSIGFQGGSDRWFDEAGPQPPNSDEEWVFSGNYEVTDVGVAGNADLIMAIAPIRATVCESINNLLKYSPVTPPVVAAGVYDDLATNLFTGTYNDGGSNLGAFGRERCVTDGNGFNFYYKVILAR